MFKPNLNTLKQMIGLVACNEMHSTCAQCGRKMTLRGLSSMEGPEQVTWTFDVPENRIENTTFKGIYSFKFEYCTKKCALSSLK